MVAWKLWTDRPVGEVRWEDQRDLEEAVEAFKTVEEEILGVEADAEEQG